MLHVPPDVSAKVINVVLIAFLNSLTFLACHTQPFVLCNPEADVCVRACVHVYACILVCVPVWLGTCVRSPRGSVSTGVWVCMYSFVCARVSFKGEVHPKVITSYLVVFGALSRMVKVRGGACDKPFWIYKPLNSCTAPAPASDDVLVVASLACPAHKNTSSSSTKTSSLAGAGAAQLFNHLCIQNGLSYAPRTFTNRLSALNTTRYEVIIFG